MISKSNVQISFPTPLHSFDKETDRVADLSSKYESRTAEWRLSELSGEGYRPSVK